MVLEESEIVELLGILASNQECFKDLVDDWNEFPDKDDIDSWFDELVNSEKGQIVTNDGTFTDESNLVAGSQKKTTASASTTTNQLRHMKRKRVAVKKFCFES